MLFNSLEYILFFCAIVPIFYATPVHLRWLPLLVGSYYFYICWHPAYIALILFSTLVDFVAARQMAATDSPAIGRNWLLVSLVSNLGLLFVFKYYNFFTDSVVGFLDAIGIKYSVSHSELLLPVGISFYTFQTLSYTIDVYRRRIEPERHLGKFALYVAFFPQLVAGPIERAAHLLPQFSERQRFDVERLSSGLRLILWGLFKKVVIADRLAEFVDRVYAEPVAHSGPTLLLATYFFAFQIYCDFSGYSDIAIGSARVLGFDLMQNFRLPYLASNISDFWRRWHISLSTWFRDYLYIPLGGNQTSSRSRWARNILATFVLSGLWHGANWTFVVWGLLHSVFFILDAATLPWRESALRRFRTPEAIAKLLGIAVTFHCVLLAWVFFRAASLTEAVMVLHRIFTQPIGEVYLGASQLTTVISIVLVLTLITVQVLQARERLPFYRNTRPQRWYIRWAAYLGLPIAIAMLGKSSSDFIYFQF